MGVIVCPSCNEAQSEIKFSGPVLWAEGVASLDPESNKIVSISPVKATQTIASGKELDAKADTFVFICSRCNYRGPRTSYKIMQACVLTGQPTDVQVDTEIGRVFVAADMAEAAGRILSRQNAGWVTTIQDEDFQ